MSRVHSADGTPIVFDQLGSGSSVILVGGAMGVRSHPMFTELVSLLAENFKVINYDRRGRGDSGDTLPYAVEREIEDIEALIDAAGEPAFVYGVSSGAVLALEAANKLSAKVKKLAIYEPPFIIDDSRSPLPSDYVHRLNEAIAAGRRGDAVEIFMTKALGLPPEFLGPMRQDPSWAEMEAVAHTLAYDGTIMGDTMSGKPETIQRWATVTVPTLVMVGGKSEAFFHTSTRALADILPYAQHRAIADQDHAISPEALAPVLKEFFVD